jgi:hypothetical protein
MEAKSMKQKENTQGKINTGSWLLWGAVLLAPITWLLQFQIRYSLVDWVCASHKTFVLHLVSLICLAIIIGGGVLSWTSWVRAGKKWPSDSAGGPEMRNLFLAMLGLLSSSMFALVTIAQAIPAFIINPCQQ